MLTLRGSRIQKITQVHVMQDLLSPGFEFMCLCPNGSDSDKSASSEELLADTFGCSFLVWAVKTVVRFAPKQRRF